MARIGYMRVSTAKQDHALQEDALKKVGCEEIFHDKISGATEIRTGLDKCLSSLKPGDTLVVWKLDRLGRNVRNLHNLIHSLMGGDVSFMSIMENLDTGTTMGRAMFGIMAVFAEMEREIISERIKAGVAVARAEGKKFGPKFKIFGDIEKEARDLAAAGVPQKDIAKKIGHSQASISRLLKRSAGVAP